eukprot:TRINITY_DN67_c0_g1_i1.p1 TRINITY_DN67_c0_g1~~TRINITY_DN67_c0_g1_i1.p1  ORF type:complete len:230 (+),score=75.69 TRINITY_DN67_c0_g1_i1:53-691(+)
MNKIFAVASLLFLATGTLATLGVDISQPTSTSAFRCMVQNGRSFAVARVGMSTGHVDPHGRQNIANAKAAGFAHVDGYIFPCPTCGNAAGQIKQTLDAIRGSGYGMLWLDIEGTQYWTRNAGTNRRFFEELVSAAKANGANIGVYSSASQWNPIFGADYRGGAGLPLWYAHYDGSPSFSDFRSFGGWGKPSIKQYRGDVNICGVGTDWNWYP